MKKELTILIVEDDQRHLTEALNILTKYHHLNPYFAGNLHEAKNLLKETTFDSAILDVVFPENISCEGDYNNALDLGRLLKDMNIPFVFNTAENHHEGVYRYFIEKSRKLAYGGFGEWKLIESYPKDSSTEAIHKQWWAAINYAILLSFSPQLNEEERYFIEKFIPFAPYGDYGQLTEKMRIVLLSTLEETFSRIVLSSNLEKTFLRNDPHPAPAPWSWDAINIINKRFFKEKQEWWAWSGEKHSFVFLRDCKEKDEQLFKELEAEIKEKYKKGFEFIRETLNFYLL